MKALCVQIDVVKVFPVVHNRIYPFKTVERAWVPFNSTCEQRLDFAITRGGNTFIHVAREPEVTEPDSRWTGSVREEPKR